MEEFIARQNIKLYREALERGAERPRRDVLLRRLIEEENKLGFTHEQLGRLDRYISRLSAIIARHVELRDKLIAAGRPLERAEMVLATLNDLMACYVVHRERLNAALK